MTHPLNQVGGALFIMASIVLVSVLGLSACSSTKDGQVESSAAWAKWKPGPYDWLSESDLEELGKVRRLQAQDKTERALERIQRLFATNPDNLPVGSFLQDLQLANLALDSLQSEQAAEELSEPAAVLGLSEALVSPDQPEKLESGAQTATRGTVPNSQARALARQWRAVATEQPTVANLLLAARLEEDGPAARLLFSRALALDPDCVWGHYGLAHRAALGGRWTESREHLDAAFRSEAGHPACRRLQASVLARSGVPRRALRTLSHWMRTVGEDARISERAMRTAWLDRARLALELGRVNDARWALVNLNDPSFEPVQQLTLLAAIEEANGRPGRALQAAREAEGLASGDPVSLAQQALLYDEWLGDPVGSLDAWERLVEGAKDRPDLKARLQSLRAEVEIERLRDRLREEALGQPGIAVLDELSGEPANGQAKEGDGVSGEENQP